MLEHELKKMKGQNIKLKSSSNLSTKQEKKIPMIQLWETSHCNIVLL